jgi:hypothetical protein
MSSKNVRDRFAKRQAPCLIANQGAKKVTWFEQRSYRGTDGFLALSQINTS